MYICMHRIFISSEMLLIGFASKNLHYCYEVQVGFIAACNDISFSIMILYFAVLIYSINCIISYYIIHK